MHRTHRALILGILFIVMAAASAAAWEPPCWSATPVMLVSSNMGRSNGGEDSDPRERKVPLGDQFVLVAALLVTALFSLKQHD